MIYFSTNGDGGEQKFTLGEAIYEVTAFPYDQKLHAPQQRQRIRSNQCDLFSRSFVVFIYLTDLGL